MKSIKFITIILFTLIINIDKLNASDKKIMIFDPEQHYGLNFYSIVQSIYPDSVNIIFALDSTINNYDALFMFLADDYNEHIIDSAESELLLNFLYEGKNIYVNSYIQSQDIFNIDFWNYIGIQYWSALFMETDIDSIIGMPNTFTDGITLHQSFHHYEMPGIGDSCYVVLYGMGTPLGFSIAYAYEPDSALVVIDLFYTFYNQTFLEKVLLHFNLIPPSFIDNKSNTVINEYKLNQNHPNPFNSRTKIEYYLPKSNFIEISLYNIQGQKIKTLYEGFQSKGHHYLVINGSNFSSGIYFYVLKSKDYKQTRKCILLK